MPDTTALADRVRAVERALTDADELPDFDTETPERLDALETRLDRVERTLADLDADLQAVRGHVGEVDRTPAKRAHRAEESPRPRDTRSPRPADFPHPVPDIESPEDEPQSSRSLRERVRSFL
ncbi:hypothetical protein U3A55_13845 [Salarchaeum sp. III]|uniref:DUF7310 family coiled-coil domain-containing protein n=1 Tax=Salarchaeum sp. III TaxID=3107927 RepID=UPI002EDACD10